MSSMQCRYYPARSSSRRISRRELRLFDHDHADPLGQAKGNARMTFGWTLTGSIAQLLLAGYLFMVVIFSASGISNGPKLSEFESGLLTACIYLLPAICVLSAGIVLYLHHHAGSAASYWWYAMPVAAAVLYLAYAMVLNQRK